MAKNVEIIAREVVRLGLADGQKVAKALKDGKTLAFMPAYAWKKYGYSVKADQWDKACFTVKLFRNIRGKMCMANTRIFSAKQVEKVSETPTVETPKVIKEEKKVVQKVETRKTETRNVETNAKKSWKPLSAKEELAKGWKPHASVMTEPKESKKETRKAEVKAEPKVIKAKKTAKKTAKATIRKAPVIKQNVYIENGIEIMHIASVNGANRIVKETKLPKSIYDSLSKANKKSLEDMVLA